MDAKLPMDTFETVMELATEGCKAIATYIREVNSFFLLVSPIYTWLSLLNSIFCCTGAVGEHETAGVSAWLVEHWLEF
jgi:hypothetical protein